MYVIHPEKNIDMLDIYICMYSHNIYIYLVIVYNVFMYIPHLFKSYYYLNNLVMYCGGVILS